MGREFITTEPIVSLSPEYNRFCFPPQLILQLRLCRAYQGGHPGVRELCPEAHPAAAVPHQEPGEQPPEAAAVTGALWPRGP